MTKIVVIKNEYDFEKVDPEVAKATKADKAFREGLLIRDEVATDEMRPNDTHQVVDGEIRRRRFSVTD